MKRILSFATALTIAAAFVAPMFMSSAAHADRYSGKSAPYTSNECSKGYKC